jgi:predicted Ser/Thr protein kinase
VDVVAGDSPRPESSLLSRRGILAALAISSILLPALGWFIGQDARGVPVATASAIGQASYFVSGTILMWKAPRNRIGGLLFAIGLFDLSALGMYSNVAVIDTISWILLGTSDVLLIVLVLTYPTGHFDDRLDRIVASAILGLLISTWVIELVAAEPSLASCRECLENPFRIFDHSVRIWWGRKVMAPAIPVAGISTIALVARRWLRSSKPARVRLTPLLVIGLAAAFLGTLDLVVEGGSLPGELPGRLIASPLIRASIPIALVIGLLRTWRRRLVATNRVAGLTAVGQPEALGPTVAAALGDPGATVVRWLPEAAGYVDRLGRPVAMPTNSAAVTTIEEGSEPLAAILHDPSLKDDRGLLEVVSGAVRLAILRERLREAVGSETAEGAGFGIGPGSTIGGFRIIRQIGRGGMGIVYLAEDAILERSVALKILAPSIGSDPAYRERFLREARLAAALDHPNVVPILAAGEDAGQLFCAMPYVEGPDLHGRIAEQGPLPLARAIEVTTQVAAALDAAHGLGIVHRDVKTANVLLDGRPERALLADFGLARPTAPGATLTVTGGFIGSLDTMAPERIRGDPAGPVSDVYALGCVLFECLVGQPPYVREGELATLWDHLQAPIPRPSDLMPGVPPSLDPVLERALAKDPAARYASAGALGDAARIAVTNVAGA